LAGMILFTGLGSMSSGHRLFEGPRMRVLYPLLPAALIIANAIVLPLAMSAFDGSGTLLRILISLLLIAPTALTLGLGFPLGLRLCERMELKLLGADTLAQHHGSALGPWLWGINGACGVCASGLALGTSMVFGINTTLLLGALCYLLLPLATLHLQRASAGQ
ncbi:MAG TPA: hypothetical protein VFN67_28575, partial [Polyangiales bacterium]|nr:hypothetical protein [Polyangiales bacterium]